MTPEREEQKAADIAWAMSTTQPEAALAVRGWYVVSGETLARHEGRIGEVAHLRQEVKRLKSKRLVAR
jgi:hypothetical protein